MVGVDAIFPGRFCHSIGGKRFEHHLEFQGRWMALELLSHEIYLRIASVYLTLTPVSSMGLGTEMAHISWNSLCWIYPIVCEMLDDVLSVGLRNREAL